MLEQSIPYPESDKLLRRAVEFRTVIGFLEHAQSRGLWVCTEPGEFESFAPAGETHEQLAYKYLGIDTKKLEEERRQMLAEMRRMNGGDT